ncbi:Hypothetical protein ETEE_1795 [Edwardsiella anguillarum ET080813]|uniref:Uncharacterized protein n=1 Tax=Edwardsiella anguillarum ET080813 TaxID=667120 RepID=A0A076LND3_9GAMM|nr:Hypothetical protein ETEE_1795 [Edwardsiella anguillarum ET080813]
MAGFFMTIPRSSAFPCHTPTDVTLTHKYLAINITFQKQSEQQN